MVPKLPPQPPVPALEAPPQTDDPASDGAVLAPQLNGLMFVNGLAAVQPDGVDAARLAGGVAAPGLPLLSGEDFVARVRPYLGRPLTRADLDAITRLVRERYRVAAQPFVEVSVPPQNVQTGVVQIVVTEYRVGEVRVSGAEHFSPDLIRRMADLETGDALSLPRLRNALDNANQNPFLTVSAVVEPGAETGVTDVVLNADDRQAIRAYAGYDNQGVRTLGRDEWNIGFNLGNVFGAGHILSYQYTRSFSGRYVSHSASDVIPVRGGDRILVFGAYAVQRPDIGFLFASEGHSSQASIRYARRLAGGSPSMSQSLQFGFDFKQADSNLEFLGFRVLDTSVEIAQFPLVYNVTLTDRWGQSDVENLLVLSPGDLTDDNTDEALQLLVPFAKARYAYDRISLTRTTFLPRGGTWIARGMAQISTGNLPYSEQVGAGGIGSVRGYDTNTLLGSEGVLFSQELRTPAFDMAKLFGSRAPGQIQLGVFWDYAYLRQNEAFPDLPNGTTLSSIGANLHYTAGRYFNVQFEVGSQLKAAPFTTAHDTRVAVVLTAGF